MLRKKVGLSAGGAICRGLIGGEIWYASKVFQYPSESQLSLSLSLLKL